MASDDLKEEGGFRTDAERIATGKYSDVFDNSQDSTQIKLQDFTKYIRRQDMTRLLSRYEIFKKAINVKGSVIECGVFRGFGLMCWALFSEIMEPVNLTRRIYGFDNFGGTKRICAKDENSVRTAKDGDFYTDAYTELLRLIQVFDENRFLGHLKKVSLINGDAAETIPRFIEENPHVLISLLFLDFDLYEPTKIALKHFLPRMPKGAIIAFDELDNPIWPGETLALLETININKLETRRLDFDPYIGYAVIDA